MHLTLDIWRYASSADTVWLRRHSFDKRFGVYSNINRDYDTLYEYVIKVKNENQPYNIVKFKYMKNSHHELIRNGVLKYIKYI